MTKLEELCAAWKAAQDAVWDAYKAAEAAEEASWDAYQAAEAAYQDELKKTQQENSYD